MDKAAPGNRNARQPFGKPCSSLPARLRMHANQSTSPRHAVTPNPSLKRSTNGRPPGPGLRYAVHFLSPSPGVLPLAPA